MARNPKWSRDELILALELYFRVNPLHTSEKNTEIIKLSDTLNELPIHPQSKHGEKFRNPAGVYMKLCNFLRFDPNSGLLTSRNFNCDLLRCEDQCHLGAGVDRWLLIHDIA